MCNHETSSDLKECEPITFSFVESPACVDIERCYVTGHVEGENFPQELREWKIDELAHFAALGLVVNVALYPACLGRYVTSGWNKDHIILLL